MTVEELTIKNEEILNKAKVLLQQASLYSGSYGLLDGWKRQEFDRLMNERANLLKQYNENVSIIESLTSRSMPKFTNQSVSFWNQYGDVQSQWNNAFTSSKESIEFWKNPWFLFGVGAVLTIVIWRNLK